MSDIPNRSSFKKRSNSPQNTLRSKFQSAAYDVAGSFIKTKVINHSLSKGEEREDPLIEFLIENLPSIYSVVKGEVVDINDNSSPQLDIMIFDSSRNIPLYSEGMYILPAEALLASIEVKSKLTKGEIKKILKSVNALKSLKPFGKKVDISKKQRTVDDKVACRYFYSVFAYESDIGETDWITKEFDRIKNVASDENLDYTLIDRIFVLNRGLINASASVGRESDDSAETFLHFYMNLLNYLERENTRRKAVPYIDYAGKLSKGWKSL